MITIEFRDGKARLEMEGETEQLCEEAALIVNALYTGLAQMNWMAGKYFEYSNFAEAKIQREQAKDTA